MIEELRSYASDGVCSLVWVSDGKATGRQVTLQEAHDFLDHHQDAEGLRKLNKRIAVIDSQPVIVSNIRRINDHTILYNGSKYTYHIDEFSKLWKEQRHCQDHFLTLEYEQDGKKMSVRNLNMRSAIRHFLNNEDKLK